MLPKKMDSNISLQRKVFQCEKAIFKAHHQLEMRPKKANLAPCSRVTR